MRLLLQHLDLVGDRLDRRRPLRGRLHLAELALDAHVEVAAELDVGAATGHVGGDGDATGNAGLGDDIGFLLVVAGVQDLELGEALLAHALGEQFRLLDRGGADQHRLAALVRVDDLGDDGLELFLEGPVDLVVLVDALDRQVGRHFDDFEIVDVAEFLRFRLRRAGHAGELVVHAEIVLEGDLRQRLVFRLDLDPFLGFQRLVLAFRIAAARHHAAGELVDDDDFVVADDVVLVALNSLWAFSALLTWWTIATFSMS